MKLAFFILFSFILVSCNSFNHYAPNNTYVVNGEEISTVAKGTSIWDTKKCDLYIPPSVPPIPKIPLEELNRNAHSLVAIDAINIKHIGELRRYIIETNKKLDDHYRNYLKQCSL